MAFIRLKTHEREIIMEPETLRERLVLCWRVLTGLAVGVMRVKNDAVYRDYIDLLKPIKKEGDE